jgi:hypothetical protein
MCVVLTPTTLIYSGVTNREGNGSLAFILRIARSMRCASCCCAIDGGSANFCSATLRGLVAGNAVLLGI